MQKPPFLERTIGNYCGVLPHFQNMSLAPTFFTISADCNLLVQESAVSTVWISHQRRDRKMCSVGCVSMLHAVE